MNLRNGQHTMAKNNYYYVEAQVAIRNALGDLGYSENVYQTMQPDLHRWATEAQDLIIRNKSSLPLIKAKFLSQNNQIRNEPDFQILENISIGGHTVPLNQTSKSTPLVSTGAPLRRIGQWGGYPGVLTNPEWVGCDRLTFRISQYAITFSPNIPDGTEVDVEYLCKPSADDGYPMIINRCARAIAYYIEAKICKRLMDSRYEDCMKEWYPACIQARAEINEMTQEEKMAIGGMYMGYGRRNRRGWGWGWGGGWGYGRW